MKRLLISIAILITLIASTSKAEYFKDVIITSPTGIWTDERAYNTLSEAISAIGSAEQTLLISRQVACDSLTIPANIKLHFVKDGSINNSGTLILETKDITAGNHQIFTGSGPINFAKGSELRSTWFSDFPTAAIATADEAVTLIISRDETVYTSCAIGDNVILKWDSPNTLSTASGITISNIGYIEAGKYQIFTGAGDFDFRQGSVLKSSWFSSLSAIDTFTDDDNVDLTIEIDRPETVSVSMTFDQYQGLKVNKGYTITINDGVVLTQGGAFEAGLYKVFNCLGSGNISFETGNIGRIYPEWWCVDGIADEIQINAAITAAPNKSTVWLSGDYLVDNTVLVSKNIVLDGLGSITGTVTWFNTKVYLIKVTGTGATVKNITVDGGGNIPPIMPPEGWDYWSSIHVLNAADVTIENVTINNSVSTGISIYGQSPRAKIHRNKIYNNYGNGINVEWNSVGDSEEPSIIGNYLQDANCSVNNVEGIRFSKVRNGTIANNILYNAGRTGILFYVGDNGTFCDNNVISSNSIYMGGITSPLEGIDFGGIGSNRGTVADGCKNNTITGNTLDMNGGGGIKFNDGNSGNTIVGNTISNVSTGILIRDQASTSGFSTDNIVTNNIIKNSTARAIDIRSARNSIIGNKLININSGVSYDAIFIGTSASQVPDGTVVFGNTLDRTGTEVCRHGILLEVSLTSGFVDAKGISPDCCSSGIVSNNIKLFTDGDSTPDVSDGVSNIYRTANTTPTTITDFSNGYQGQVINVLIYDANTTIDFTGTPLKGNNGVDWVPSDRDWMQCTYMSGYWYCSVHDTTP
jgi:parallel beta-helix repeat protein